MDAPQARVRTVGGVFADGDLVLRRGVPETSWRGGVVRSLPGRRVVVETLAGFEEVDEQDLIPADSGDSERRGAVGRARESMRAQLITGLPRQG